MTPQERIDAALDSVLRASGSALKHYTTPPTLEKMREAMRKVMSDSYIAGVHSEQEVMRECQQRKVDRMGKRA